MKKGLIIAVLALTTLLSVTKAADAFTLPNFLNLYSHIERRISIINVLPYFNRIDNKVVVYFSNLEDAKKISYELTYSHNGQKEGVLGDFTVNGQKLIKKEIFLGTCSTGGTCIMHKNVRNIKLEITVTYNNGKSLSKHYKVW
jgi:hypothetical protein